jgi:hypothetical protein
VLSRVGEIFDGVKLSNSTRWSSTIPCSWRWSPMSGRARAGPWPRSGAKAVFIQDEYRFVNATLEALEACGVDLVFTCLGPAEAERIYGQASAASCAPSRC